MGLLLPRRRRAEQLNDLHTVAQSLDQLSLRDLAVMVPVALVEGFPQHSDPLGTETLLQGLLVHLLLGGSLDRHCAVLIAAISGRGRPARAHAHCPSVLLE